MVGRDTAAAEKRKRCRTLNSACMASGLGAKKLAMSFRVSSLLHAKYRQVILRIRREKKIGPSVHG